MNKSELTMAIYSIKFGVLDPFRRLCESHDLDYFVVVQPTSSPPGAGYWTASKALRNLCGDLISRVSDSLAFVHIMADNVI